MMQASKEMLVFFWHKLWKIKITPFMWELHVQTRTRTKHNSSFSRQRSSLLFSLSRISPLTPPLLELVTKAKHSFYLISPFKSAWKRAGTESQEGARACPLYRSCIVLSCPLFLIRLLHRLSAKKNSSNLVVKWPAGGCTLTSEKSIEKHFHFWGVFITRFI